MNRLTTRELAYGAVGVALLSVCSWLSIPTTVPFTMQTFAVCLLAALFGWKLGALSVAAWLLLGALGAPVFAGFTGGPAALLGVTGGYLAGFLFTALVVGGEAEREGRELRTLLPAMALGLLLCYTFGTAWFLFVYARKTGPIGLGTALAWCVLPYLIPDAVKLTLAAALAKRLYPLLSKERST